MRSAIEIIVVGATLIAAVSCRPDEPRPDTMAEEAPGLQIESVGFGAGGVVLSFDAEYVGSERCRTCHLSHSRTMQDHPMARTGRLVTMENRDEWFSEERIDKPLRWPPGEPSSPVGYHRDETGVYLEATGDDGTTLRADVAVIFGSGRHGFTPIAVAEDRRVRELRTSFFGAEDVWIMTPGLAGLGDAVGLVHTRETSHLCLGCHSTVLAWDGDRLDPEASTFGIGCERCHGPGSAHIEAIATTTSGDPKIFNPGALSTTGLVGFCGQCHRQAADVEARDVLGRAPVLARHAGAGITLSACFRKSPPNDTIGCLDCHDPHHSEKPLEATLRTCLRCHSDPGALHVTTTVTASSDCTPCHMPRESEGFFGMSFTDHWIAIPDSPPPEAAEDGEEYARYMEQCYIEAIGRRPLGAESAARLRMYLVDHLLAQDRSEDALPWLAEVLTLEPRYRDRLIAAREFYFAGDVDAAAAALEGAIAAQPTVNEAYYKLFRVYLDDGDRDRARAVIARWAEAIPDDATVWKAREELLRSVDGSAVGP